MRDRAEDISGVKTARTVKMATALASLRGVVSSSVSGYVWAPPCKGAPLCAPLAASLPSKEAAGTVRFLQVGKLLWSWTEENIFEGFCWPFFFSEI